MDQKTREQWVIPIIIAVATGVPLIILGVYITALATGAPLRPPFTLGWVKSLFSVSVQMPLWMILLIAAITAAVLLYVRRRARRKQEVATKPSAASPPNHPAFPADGTDGVHRTTVRFIMYGQDQLMAYTTTRDGFPGTRYLVVRNRPDQQPASLETADLAAANTRWTEWYREQKAKGFGGWSGNGLDGEPPF